MSSRPPTAALLGGTLRITQARRALERRKAGRDLHLHIDGARLDTFEYNCGDSLDHCAPRGRQDSRIRTGWQEQLGNRNAIQFPLAWGLTSVPGDPM